MPLNLQEENAQLSERLSAALEKIELLSRVQLLEGQRMDFFRRFRHDCVSPLGSISGFLDLLQDSQYGELNSRQRGYVQNLQRSTQSLLLLVERTSSTMNIR
jgi:signal transduction histidine kinase